MWIFLCQKHLYCSIDKNIYGQGRRGGGGGIMREGNNRIKTHRTFFFSQLLSLIHEFVRVSINCIQFILCFYTAYERDSTQTIDAQSGEDLSDEGFLDLQSVLREPISSHSLDEEFCQAESLSPEPLVEPESLYSGPEFDIEDDIP